jgi:nucleotide-binding universal stress UspA family protein
MLIPAFAPLWTIPKNIAIAWKPTLEAARAVATAMPFLALAKQIDVISIVEEAHATDESGARLVATLARHGLEARARQLRPASNSAVDALLGAATEVSADLLVMGGYGHSRWREWVLGGFTQQILRSAPLAVLMTH